MVNGENDITRKMDYQEVLEFLYNNLPMFQREGGLAFKPGLNNIKILLEKLGNPQTKFKAVHIAGTNGKGSVSHMLCSVLMEAGYKTGLYTSPHLLDYRERIRVNGKKIKKKYIVGFINRIIPLCNEIKPSFFEVTVAMAFDYFAKRKVDIAVIETGMGGRLDSTNILIPVISVITNIGFDHTQYLGHKLSEIAKEKAGIIKNKIPVIIGETHPETRQVFTNVCKEKKAKVKFADMYYKTVIKERGRHYQKYRIYNEGKVIEKKLKTDLTGSYQVKNISTLYMIIGQLSKLRVKVKSKNVRKGLLKVKEKTGLMGRWDVMKKEPLVILDISHNLEGFKELNKQLKALKYKKLFLIFGTNKDKDVDSLFSAMPSNGFYFFTKANLLRSMEINDLYKIAQKSSYNGITCANVKIAYMYAMSMADKDDLILITGSSFVVAEALRDIEF